MKTEKIRTELEKARRRAAEWLARAKDLERQLTEQENLEIIQAVRSITASPEELGDILGKIRSMKLCAEPLAETMPGAEETVSVKTMPGVAETAPAETIPETEESVSVKTVLGAAETAPEGTMPGVEAIESGETMPETVKAVPEAAGIPQEP